MAVFPQPPRGEPSLGGANPFLGNTTQSFSLPLRLFAWRLQGISFLAGPRSPRFSIASQSVAVSTQRLAPPVLRNAYPSQRIADPFFALANHADQIQSITAPCHRHQFSALPPQFGSFLRSSIANLRQCYLLTADPQPCLGASCFSSPLLGGAVPCHRTAKQILCQAAFASPLPVHPLPFQLSGLLRHRPPPPCGSIPQRPCPLPSLFLRIALLCWAVALRVESKHRPRFFATPFRMNAMPFHIGARRFFAAALPLIAVSAVAFSADPCSSTHSHSLSAQVRAVP